MATSRTGTATHKHMVKVVIAEAQAQGITHCPGCGIELDYTNRRAPNGAQADEIIPYVLRGHTSTNPMDWRVLCARCNQSKGGRMVPTRAERFPASRAW